MSRQVFLLGVALPLVAGAFALTNWLLTPPAGVTEPNVRRIRAGMTRQNVEALFGDPGTPHIIATSIKTVTAADRGSDLPGTSRPSKGGFVPWSYSTPSVSGSMSKCSGPARAWVTWEGDRLEVVVGFGLDERVVELTVNGQDRSRSLAGLGSWLGW